ncbi:hypothetical protein JEQ12_007982 [Ovis aries]|uniref:Uncharacterized protein n=1 Tax=Ovis aries TaxID=9940 RepID=A0A835ZYZ2_SHEEP|nr:hypothetical protein JEQ12_007982 [Ovis aries]
MTPKAPKGPERENRTGCPQFGECEFSMYTGSLPSLEESSEQLKDTVTFLLGGSFSLGGVWEDAGLPAYKRSQELRSWTRPRFRQRY